MPPNNTAHFYIKKLLTPRPHSLHMTFPISPKNSQRTIRQKTHQQETFVWVHNINLAHSTLLQNSLRFLYEMMVSVIGIIILHLLRHNKELQRKKIKPLYRELVIQNIGNSLSAEPLLAEMFRQDRG